MGAKAYSTRYSQEVSHPSTNQARPCLASEIRRDRALPGWDGRRHLLLLLRPSCHLRAKQHPPHRAPKDAFSVSTSLTLSMTPQPPPTLSPVILTQHSLWINSAPAAHCPTSRNFMEEDVPALLSPPKATCGSRYSACSAIQLLTQPLTSRNIHSSL